MHKADALIIGNGIAGLLLALGLSRTGKNITIVYRPQSEGENSPLVLPSPARELLNMVSPGSIEELIAEGATSLTHAELILMKFPGLSLKPETHDSFLLLSRNLLMSYLMKKGEMAGINFVQAEVEKLLLTDKTATGIQTKTGDIFSPVIFDCTGSPGPRRGWFEASGLIPDSQIVRGEREKLFVRFFETSLKRPLILHSGNNFRGGIYPIEKNLFVLSVATPVNSAPEDSQIDQWAGSIADQLGASELFRNSGPVGKWNILHQVENLASDFYRSGKWEEVRGFYPLGDGLLFSNPVYGRGLSLFSFQVSPFLKNVGNKDQLGHDVVSRYLRAGEKEARGKWKEILPEGPAVIQKLIRKIYLPLLDKDPGAYQSFLEFYQMKISASRLAIRLLRNALSSFFPR